jgi:hypothetical protein
MTRESNAQKLIRIQASADGFTLWRNNVGVLTDARAIPVRFGLANESRRMNAELKSGDLIGWSPGGIFVSIECKEPDWQWTGTPREVAQLSWINVVLHAGALACFARTWPEALLNFHYRRTGVRS